MSDLARELPLFGRAPVDESAVSSDWKEALADVIHQAAFIAQGGDDPHRAAEEFVRNAGLSARTADLDLVALSEAVRAGKPQRVRALSRTVTALLMLAGSRNVAAEVAPRTAGAVCLYRTGAAPLAIRAVISGHTLRATDAQWSFGRGPVLQDTSMRLLAFFCGLSLEAPQTPPAVQAGSPSVPDATLEK